MATNYTYDLTQKSTDFQGSFIDLIVSEPTLLNHFGILGATSNGRTHNWMERSLSPATTTISTFDTDGDGTGINVASATGIAVNDVLYFESATGQYRSENVLVTAVSTNDLTVTRDYASSPGVTLVVGDIVHISNTTAEDATALTSGITRETEFTNYTKTYSKAFSITTLAQKTPVNGILTGGDAQKAYDGEQQKAREIRWQILKDFIWLYKGAATNITTAKGTLGGFKQFQASGNIVTTGGAVSLDHFNDANELIFKDGAGASASRIAVMNVNQARRLSAIPTSGTNPLITRPERDTTTGSYVTSIIGDIPGNVNQIVIEPNMPKDEIWILDPAEIKMVVNLPMVSTDATNENQKPLVNVRRLTTDITWEIKNAKLAHATMTGLTV